MYKIYNPSMHYLFPSYPYDWVYGLDTLKLGVEYHYADNYDNMKILYIDRDTTYRYTEKIKREIIKYANNGNVLWEKYETINYKNYRKMNVYIDKIDSTTFKHQIKYHYGQSGMKNNKILSAHITTKRNTGNYDSTFINLKYNYKKNNDSIYLESINVHNQSGGTKSFKSFMPKPFNLKNDSITYTIDENENIIKRKYFFVSTSCSSFNGRYDYIDSTFNDNGQLIQVYTNNVNLINSPANYPYFTFKKIFYHPNGQIAYINKDDNRKYYYNEKGQILSDSEFNFTRNYLYDKQGNLISINHIDETMDSVKTFLIKYKNEYNQENKLERTYIYYQINSDIPCCESAHYITNTKDLYKYPFATYKYNSFGDLIQKDEYNQDIFLGVNRNPNIHLIDKRIEYKYNYK